MEASERPQLPLDPAGSDGAGRAIGDRPVVERLGVTGAGAARVVQEQVREGHQPAATVTRAIEIGTRVIESEGTAANVDYVKAELERQLSPLAERLGTVMEDGQEEFVERLASSFDDARSGSVQPQIRELLPAAMEHQRTQLARRFAAHGGANP